MTPQQQGPEERSPWARPGVLISGAFLLLLILAGIIVAVAGGGDNGHHTSTTPQAPGKSATSPNRGSTSACTLPPGNQTLPSASPPTGTTWAQVGSMQVPQAPSTLGPQRTSGIWNTCFAHSPSGALLAAINLWAAGTTTATPSEVFQRLAVGAPKNLGSNQNLVTAAGGSVQLAGYKYDSYTTNNAAISVVLQGPQGKLIAIVTPMRWNGSDWKYVFPSNGLPAFQAISDLTGYVSWSEFS